MDTTAPFQGGTIPDVILDQDERGPAVLKIHESWFSEKKGECVSFYLVFSPLGDLEFLSRLDGVPLRFTREHVFPNVDADPLLTC